MADPQPHSTGLPRLSRRDFLKAGSAVLGTAALAPRGAAQTPAAPPNILLIVTDQQVVDSIGAYAGYFTHPAYGAHHVHTPNLDRLVGRGVSFLQHYVPNSVCSPCRSCLFTGRHSVETGVITNNIGIDDAVPNMGQWFEQNSNYSRYYCGKWHAGGAWNNPSTSGSRKIPGFETIPVSGGTGDFVDYCVSGAVAAFVRNYGQTNPFLVVAGLMNPHDIAYYYPDSGTYTTPNEDNFKVFDDAPPLPPNFAYDFPDPFGSEYTGYTPGMWRNYMYDYFRMVEKVDHDVGRMLEAVESRADDTLVIFTADHGEGLGRHGRVSKWHPYDHSFRTPMIVACPGRGVGQNVLDSTHLTSGVDIMSTVCDYAGIAPPPNARGVSLRPLLHGETPSAWRTNVYAELRQTARLIRTERYKYVKFYTFSGNTDLPFVRKSDGAAVQFVQGRGTDYAENPTHLLFDMIDDPWEQHNLFADPQFAAVMTAHEAILRDWESRLIVGQHFDRN